MKQALFVGCLILISACGSNSQEELLRLKEKMRDDSMKRIIDSLKRPLGPPREELYMHEKAYFDSVQHYNDSVANADKMKMEHDQHVADSLNNRMKNKWNGNGKSSYHYNYIDTTISQNNGGAKPTAYDESYIEELNNERYGASRYLSLSIKVGEAFWTTKTVITCSLTSLARYIDYKDVVVTVEYLSATKSTID